jgi:hypothetical protein
VGDHAILVALSVHGSEVKNMIMAEFNLETAKQVWREECLEEGLLEAAKWRKLAAEKEAALAEQAALIAELRSWLGEDK